MAIQSSAEFLVLNALRIKRRKGLDVLSQVTGLGPDAVDSVLAEFERSGHVTLDGSASVWRLTEAGRGHHLDLVAEDAGHSSVRQRMLTAYQRFLPVNAEVKQICTDWQIRAGALNDHSDREYDSAVIARLVEIDPEAQLRCTEFADAVARFRLYGRRFGEAVLAVVSGRTEFFTGVIEGSYHDVLMELHQDLTIALGIDRAAEASG